MLTWIKSLTVGFVVTLGLLTGAQSTALALQPAEPVIFGSVVVDGSLYLTTSLGLHAIDATTGKERWRVTTPRWADSQPVAADGMVYFVSEWNPPANPSAVVHAVDASTGQEVWTFEPGGPLRADSRRGISPLIVSDQTIYVFDDFHVYLLDAQTGPVNGEPTDTAFLPMGVTLVAAHGDRALLSNLSHTEVGCVDLATGDQLWTAKVSTDSFDALSASNDTTLFLVDADNALVALNWETGEELWGVPPAEGGSIEFVRAQQGNVLYGFGEEVDVVDAASGTVSWQLPLTTGYPDVAVVNDDTVFVATDDRSLAAYDLETGAARWSVALPAPAIGLSIDPTGNLVVVLAGIDPDSDDSPTSDALLIASSDGSRLWEMSVQP